MCPCTSARPVVRLQEGTTDSAEAHRSQAMAPFAPATKSTPTLPMFVLKGESFERQEMLDVPRYNSLSRRDRVRRDRRRRR